MNIIRGASEDRNKTYSDVRCRGPQLATKKNVKIEHLIDKTILLIDDVATTGATIEECAKVLKQNGASCVIAITFARS